jgi:glycosyltransferase involved in cell wall biosynthesis
MRIAYVCQAYPPMVSGAALVTQRLAEGMARRGHDVLVLAASDRDEPYDDCSNGVRQVRLRSLPNPARVDQRFLVWPQAEMVAELRSFRPDVVHLQEPLNAGLCALRIAHGLELPVALTIHALPWFVAAYAPDLPGLRPRIEAGLWSYASWLAHQCQAVVTPSHVIADMVYEHCDCRPQVISNGVDLKRFTPRSAAGDEGEELRAKYGLDADLPVILHVGRIDADKQVDLVVQAAARAMRSANAQLLIVGNGTRLNDVMRLSEQLGIRDRCRFPGYVPATGDLPGLYRLASVFITASEIETQGLVVLEAAATALPVVAVGAASLPESVQDGVTGYLAAPRDISGMADRLVSLLRDPGRADAMGQAGRSAMAGHSADRSVKAHEMLYHSLVAQGRRR